MGADSVMGTMVEFPLGLCDWHGGRLFIYLAPRAMAQKVVSQTLDE